MATIPSGSDGLRGTKRKASSQHNEENEYTSESDGNLLDLPLPNNSVTQTRPCGLDGIGRGIKFVASQTHGGPVRKKPKPMIPLTCPRNVDDASPDAAEPTSSNTRRTSHTALPSTSFRSDPPPSGLSNSFSRSDSPPSNHEKTDEEPVGEFLWRGVRRRMGIKDSSPKQASLCEYNWEVVACMVITGEGRSGPDIWPETPNQGIGTENMILTTWYKEAMKRREINPKQQHPPSPTAKEARYILDSIIGFRAHMMEKIRGLVGVHYQLQNNGAALLRRLSDGHGFLDPDLDKPGRQRFIAPVIVLAIMTCFFSGTDSYGLGRKAYTSRFFSPFRGEMVVVICSMLAVAIKDLALRWNNKELATGKSAVRFEPASQKKATRDYVRNGETWVENRADRNEKILTILRKRVLKQAFGRGGELKEKVMPLSNVFSNRLDDLVDSSDEENVIRCCRTRNATSLRLPGTGRKKIAEEGASGRNRVAGHSEMEEGTSEKNRVAGHPEMEEGATGRNRVADHSEIEKEIEGADRDTSEDETLNSRVNEERQPLAGETLSHTSSGNQDTARLPRPQHKAPVIRPSGLDARFNFASTGMIATRGSQDPLAGVKKSAIP